jgi:hypothetical protein
LISVLISASTYSSKICLSVINRVYFEAVFQELQRSLRAHSIKLRYKGVSQGF